MLMPRQRKSGEFNLLTLWIGSQAYIYIHICMCVVCPLTFWEIKQETPLPPAPLVTLHLALKKKQIFPKRPQKCTQEIIESRTCRPGHHLPWSLIAPPNNENISFLDKQSVGVAFFFLVHPGGIATHSPYSKQYISILFLFEKWPIGFKFLYFCAKQLSLLPYCCRCCCLVPISFGAVITLPCVSSFAPRYMYIYTHVCIYIYI